jgi:tRNA1Val (adenine37-N6)-methyltransferase
MPFSVRYSLFLVRYSIAMSNTFFQFKQFTIHQEHCAMKVCTDACLFGGWMGEKVKNQKSKIKNILDVGAGTGLLSLMLAQESNARIDAVEIDEQAAMQAADNMESSPWKERLQVIEGDIRQLHLGRKYDLVITNPPFFENNLKSPDGKRNLALHSESLSLEELTGVVQKELAADGAFAILLPYERKDECISLAASIGLFPEEIVTVKQSELHGFFRVMIWFEKKQATTVENTVSIRDGNAYSPAFATLLKDYYLYL